MVNLLLALAWPNHQFHRRARVWFGQHAGAGWTTCAVTQLGFVRLSSNPSYTPLARTPLEASRLLEEWTSRPDHSFVSELPPCTGDAFREHAGRMPGHKQTTDAYLLVLARHHALRLVTFDRKIARLSPEAGRVTVIATEG